MGKKFLVGAGIVIILAGAGFFYFSFETYHSRGTRMEEGVFRINKGENAMMVATHLEEEGLIARRWYFLYYFWKEQLRGRTVAGEYLLSGTLSIPDIAHIITKGDIRQTAISITFPEGWDSRKMAERLTANGLDGDGFLRLVREPLPAWREEFAFLKDVPARVSLEGFLFPDTYLFSRNAQAEDIILKMLKNFDAKLDARFQAEIAAQGKGLFAVLTLASIVENEVTSVRDRKMTADIFWRRMHISQPLESDATVKFILGENKIQHSFEETRVDSPYNTYTHKGLPPGPIGNPGLESIDATIHPTANPYFYFLSDPKTGETVFAETFDQHKVNKTQHGL